MVKFRKPEIALCAAFALAAMLAVTLAGCGGRNGGRNDAPGSPGYKVRSQGAPYELVVVAGHDQWDGPVGDTIRSIFGRQVPMVSRQETIYDVLRVLPDGFRKLITRHPNILMVNVDGRFDDSRIQVRRDVYAAPQIVIAADAPDNAAMTELLDARRGEILALLEEAERERDLANARLHGPKQVTELIKTKFGFDMDLTPGFTVRSDRPGFLWLSYETPMSSQGVVIYTYPLAGPSDLTEESLLRRRDEFAGLIPGENPGSHMATNPEFTELLHTRINGRQWSEMHGFWDVAGDFMGGPYVNYSTVDEPNRRVIAIDLYVYAPGSANVRMSQRNYKNQLQHLIYSVHMPGPEHQ